MRLDRLDAVGRGLLQEALRLGEPVFLDLAAPPPAQVRLDDVVPLCHAVRAWTERETEGLRALLPPAARPGSRATITAVVPTHRHTPWGLEVLRGQDVQVEVLVLANGTRNGIAIDADRVVEVPWEGHGPTRQRGVEQADGEYILLTVDDAIPRGAGFVRTLVEALEEGGFDAVFARQIPWPLADPITFRRLRDWTPAGTQVRMVDRLDHVATLVRRRTLLENPLPPVPIAEDLHWGRGRRIGYVPMAPVLHSHERISGPLFDRTRAIHLEHLVLGDAPRIPSLLALAVALPSVLVPVLESGPKELANQGAELVGQWMAMRDYRRRKP